MTQQIDREWIVSDSTRARLASVREWIALRVSERERATASRIAADAAAGPNTYAMTDDPDSNGNAEIRVVPTVRKTTNAMADHASQALAISGVHVLPVFGKGEHTAPYLGSDESVSAYASEAAEDAWRYVAADTITSAFMARVISAMRLKADKDGRPIDHGKREDVASEARALFVNLITDLMTREDVTRVYGWRAGTVDTGERDTVGGIAEFLAPRLARCGACDACQRSNVTSRWLIGGCEMPVMTIDAVTPNRVLTRAIMRAVADPTLSTSSVYATRSKYFLRNLTADAVNDDAVNVNGGDDALRYTPRDAADLVRFMVAALDSIGEADNATVTKGLSPVARAIFTRLMGTEDTGQGAETALKRARELWPASHGTRREARERVSAERTRARDDRRNAGKRERRAAAAREAAASA